MSFKELLEQVSEYERIPIPDGLRFGDHGKYRKFLAQVVSQLDTYHRSKETDDLKRTVTLSLRLIEMMKDDLTDQRLRHEHEMRLLKSKLASFIQVKKEKDKNDDQDF
jgi:hypothetical protein